MIDIAGPTGFVRDLYARGQEGGKALIEFLPQQYLNHSFRGSWRYDLPGGDQLHRLRQSAGGRAIIQSLAEGDIILHAAPHDHPLDAEGLNEVIDLAWA